MPVYDDGVDFILYRESDNELRKVQLNSRWTIDRKYMGRNIWVAFPIAGEWYLMPHDKMFAAGEADGVTLTWGPLRKRTISYVRATAKA